ncbi:thymidylate kinase [Rhodococcus sp. MTM3W5.2]|uniref:dTMP kinase n=1 Tax=Rhodococcus sp. MTM3W5.2 TaxID=1805827 RepID=UPI0009792CF8|nr:dTMP kinase [Rhodococcus sp. MTM3W5.2]AQA22461.1 thymidylate kinase [Rhodococcus sp. MTM3W5.2]
MGTLIALEGLDGAGKRTLVDKLVSELTSAGVRVAVHTFPRYGVSIHADLAAEALKGAHGDLAESVHAMAVLFALDRGGAVAELADLLERHDIVLLDRYVASNAAYGAARLRQGPDGEFVRWVRELEFDRLGLPRPALQMLLDVPVELARARARAREASDSTRELDAYERDSDLQTRTGAVYRGLAQREWVSSWKLIDPNVDPAALAADLAQWI